MPKCSVYHLTKLSYYYYSHFTDGETRAQGSRNLPMISLSVGGGTRIQTPVRQTLRPQSCPCTVAPVCREDPNPTSGWREKGVFLSHLGKSLKVPAPLPFMGTASFLKRQSQVNPIQQTIPDSRFAQGASEGVRGESVPGCQESRSSWRLWSHNSWAEVTLEITQSPKLGLKEKPDNEIPLHTY